MKSKLIVLLSVLMLAVCGAAFAGEEPLIPAVDPALSEAGQTPPEPGCGDPEALPAELFQNSTPAAPPEPVWKAGGTYTYGGCQCYTNCVSTSCFCSADYCCSSCCQAARAALC